MENNFTPEQMEMAKAAKSPEELLSLANENGFDITEEQAADYFERIHKSGELFGDELSNVAGGGCQHKKGWLVTTPSDSCPRWTCPKCGKSENNSSNNNRWYNQLFVTTHYCENYLCLMQCKYCKYISYEDKLWLCKNEENRK